MKILVTGIIVIDVIAADLPKIANPSEIIFCKRGIEVHLGGHALNVSQNLKKIVAPTDHLLVIGPVGKDVFGNYVKDRLSELGISHELQEFDTMTSKDLILVVKNEDRRYHADAGANLFMEKEKILRVMEKFAPDFFYLGGAGLLGNLDDEISEICKRSQELGILNMIDVVSPYDKNWDFMLSALKHVDIFHCNYEEARQITNEMNSLIAIKILHQYGCKIVILTLGADGVMIHLPNNKILTMNAFQTKVIDPTGAGDAFCAGFISNLLQKGHKNLETIDLDAWKDILMRASAVAAACLTGVGTSSGVKKDLIDDYIKNQGQDIIKSSKVILN